MSINVKISKESVGYARIQSKVFHRTLGGQIDYWVSIGMLAEKHPGLTFDHLQKLMHSNQLGRLEDTKGHKCFQAVSLDTKSYRFNRDQANER